MNMRSKNENPFKLKRSKVVYKNPWITVREDKVIRPGGKRGIFGVVEMVPGSSVLPFDGEYVYLVNEFKYGVGRESLEVISGAIDHRETPLAAAKRELEEETGFQASNWTALAHVDPFTTVVNSPNYIFLARKLKKGKKHTDEGEHLKTMKVKFREVIRMAMDGKISHAGSVVAILKTARLLQKRKS